MQEALDGELESEALHELYQRIDANPDEASDFQKLKHIDRLLRAAPMERAPQGLALKIMARLAEGLQPERLMRSSGLALALGLALVTLVLTPLLAGLGWLILNAIGNAGALTALINQIAGLLSMVMMTLDALVSGARDVLNAYPEAPALMIALIPIALFWLLRFAWRKE
jgi:anti-sigma factor RsiW